MMTKEEMRVAIAEKCGYEVRQTDYKTYEVLLNGNGLYSDRTRFYDNEEQAMLHEYPNYPEDLNAMADAEGVMTEVQFAVYCTELQCIIVGDRNPSPEKDYLNSMLPSSKLIVKAKASQRAEAFCRVFWPERFS